jgi:hypothetical protein
MLICCPPSFLDRQLASFIKRKNSDQHTIESLRRSGKPVFLTMNHS